jgi:uncharacterized protein
MTLRDDILSRLRCPVTRSPLVPATERQLALLNRRIAAGQAQTRLSAVVTEPLTAGLVNADQSLLYRYDGGMLVLLASEAIELEDDAPEADEALNDLAHDS